MLSLLFLLLLNPPSSSSLLNDRLPVSIKLSPRLDAVHILADLVSGPGSVIADIGADHAKLAVALLLSPKDQFVRDVIAVDRCSQPLESGRSYAKKVLPSALLPHISFRHGDGLKPLQLHDNVTTVCIAGLGARSIMSILSGLDQHATDVSVTKLRVLGVSNLVLQPVSPRPHYMIPLRQWLSANGWAIDDEIINFDGGRYYISVLASRATMRCNDGQSKTSLTTKAEDLIFPFRLRERVHESSPWATNFAESTKSLRSSYSLANKGRDLERGVETRMKEVELWWGYCEHHASWVDVFDGYDAELGLPAGFVSRAYKQELELLKRINTQRYPE